ncbi:F-BAR domain only protein 2-like [Pseudopipra pipra]|uniref:F-BAR domain only protein 2-like n=1 Tax=Pseudopipra pipra TaxID=415032 RepID=UPI00313987AF
MGGNIVIKDEEKAEVFNTFFTSVFNSKTDCPEDSWLLELVDRHKKLNSPPVIQEETMTHLVDEGKAVDVVYLDFSKAFDTVSHSILLKKLAAHGSDRCTLCWVRNWLEGRAQTVVVNGAASSEELTKSKLSTPANEKGNSDLLAWNPLLSSSLESSSSGLIVSSSSSARPTNRLSVGTTVPPPRPASSPKLSTGKFSGINEIPRPFSPPLTSNSSPPPAAPLAHAESISSISSSVSLSTANTPTVGVSRGPSPVRLGNQDIVPVAVALTESVNAYFKGADPTKCIVKITGDMTLSFPSGIIKVFTSNPSPSTLCFRVKNTSKLDQILPNAQLVYSNQSQSDSSSKDFWMNMQAITVYLKKLSEHNPSASYYNVDVLKYQVNTFFPLEFFKELWQISYLYRNYKNCYLPVCMQMNCHPSSKPVLENFTESSNVDVDTSQLMSN